MAQKKTNLIETEDILKKFWIEYIDADMLEREKKIDFIVKELIKVGELNMKKKHKFHTMMILFRSYLDDLIEIMDNKSIEDSEKDAKKFIQILETADGGCSYCAENLLEEFIKKFPQYKGLVEKKLKPLKLRNKG